MAIWDKTIKKKPGTLNPKTTKIYGCSSHPNMVCHGMSMYFIVPVADMFERRLYRPSQLADALMPMRLKQVIGFEMSEGQVV